MSLIWAFVSVGMVLYVADGLYSQVWLAWRTKRPAAWVGVVLCSALIVGNLANAWRWCP